jgi:hypothetical protein
MLLKFTATLAYLDVLAITWGPCSWTYPSESKLLQRSTIVACLPLADTFDFYSLPYARSRQSRSAVSSSP